MDKRLLALGDFLALLIVTAIGFISHGEADASFLPRAAAILIPLTAGWFLLAPATGLFRVENVREAKQLWRPALTGFFTAQFAIPLRGLLLNSAILPIFAIVLGATTAFGMLVWRTIALRLSNR